MDPAVFPSNQQFIKHFGEFLHFGYKQHLGYIDVKFNHRDQTRAILNHSVGYIDGQTKVLLMVGIVAIAKHLEVVPNEDLRRTLHSFRHIACNCMQLDNPAHAYLHSLRS